MKQLQLASRASLMTALVIWLNPLSGDMHISTQSHSSMQKVRCGRVCVCVCKDSVCVCDIMIECTCVCVIVCCV